MKKILVSLFVLVVALVALTACAPKTYEIALVTDVGNIDDKSFNESAWIGVKEFAKENKVTYAYYRPTEDTTNARLEAIDAAVEKGAKVIVCPGFLFEEAIGTAQNTYPNVAFVLLDTSAPNQKNNVYSILYKEEQAGYLAGYAAVMEGYRKLGFLGGMAVPAVVRFGYGYVQGADAAATALGLANGAVTIEYDYAGGFGPAPEIKTKMDGWYGSGTEVVFACGGGIYLSVLASAQAITGKKMIGVDKDQAFESPLIITSAMKDITNSVLLALDSFYKNGKSWDSNHAGKTVTLGAAENCVGLPKGDSWRLTKFTTTQYDTLFAKLVNGTVVVADSITVRPTVSAKVVVHYLDQPAN